MRTLESSYSWLPRRIPSGPINLQTILSMLRNQLIVWEMKWCRRWLRWINHQPHSPCWREKKILWTHELENSFGITSQLYMNHDPALELRKTWAIWEISFCHEAVGNRSVKLSLTELSTSVGRLRHSPGLIPVKWWILHCTSYNETRTLSKPSETALLSSSRYFLEINSPVSTHEVVPNQLRILVNLLLVTNHSFI